MECPHRCWRLNVWHREGVVGRCTYRSEIGEGWKGVEDGDVLCADNPLNGGGEELHCF